MTTTASGPPTCEAKTGWYAGEWSELPLWCNARVGLSTWTDRQGFTHRACRHHRAAMLHRYPAVEEAVQGCLVCKRPVIEYLAISVATATRTGVVCHVCQERGDER